MNKKELNEIKKNFNDDSGLFVINTFFSAYIDPEKNVKYKMSKPYSIIADDEREVITDSLKKVLTGTIGKHLVEYEFPLESFEDGKAQKILYDLVESKMKDESLIDTFLEKITSNIDYAASFTLLAAHCTYSIMRKNRNDDDDPDNVTDEYNFIVTAVCPANTNDVGLFYDEESCTISKKTNNEMIISKIPTDGFMYPVFSDRSPDVNHIMYFSKKADKPNISIIENVLDCVFVMSAENEKARFQQVLNAVCSDELNYNVITQVNDKIREVVELSRNETEAAKINDKQLKHILSDAGVSEEKLQALEPAYQQIVGETDLTASNLAENRTVVSTPDVTINIKKDAACRLRTSSIEGRNCLIIDLDDPNIVVNGLPAVLK
ncbi:DUF4317 family protein [Ruminococcus sp. HUN007]|uniref:DUF4317 family protein n=1 Tax=Ruminococcus sp. HUN007 TaxID=1514668 RepID=UPI0005D2A4BE|nr:DUF4317 family protein [Ruminococcus sp. HUN007]